MSNGDWLVSILIGIAYFINLAATAPYSDKTANGQGWEVLDEQQVSILGGIIAF